MEDKENGDRDSAITAGWQCVKTEKWKPSKDSSASIFCCHYSGLNNPMRLNGEISVAGINLDITERRRMEDALRNVNGSMKDLSV